MKHDEYHRQFADAIIEQIRQGTAPWQKPWGPGERVLPANVDAGRSYSGGNSLPPGRRPAGARLRRCRWGTYRQIQARGGQVRKGERGTRDPLVPGPPESRRHRRARTARQGQRGASASTATSACPHPSSGSTTCSTPSRPMGSRAPGPRPRPSRSGRSTMRPRRCSSGVPVRHMAGDRAFYSLNNDEITLPERMQFPSANHYYQTALHELGHSTGHPERMNRATLTQGMADGFGSPAYAKEKLRAEISAMMTGERVGRRPRPEPRRRLRRGVGRRAEGGPPGDPPRRGRRAQDLRLRPCPEPRAPSRARAGPGGSRPQSSSHSTTRPAAGNSAAGTDPQLRPEPLRPRRQPNRCSTE